MDDNILYSVKEMVTLLSKQNISLVHKKNDKLVLGQFISENTYIPLNTETDSFEEIFILLSEMAIESLEKDNE